MFVQVYVVQLSSELGEARGCWGGEGGGRGRACPSSGGRRKLVHACLTSLAKLVGGPSKLVYACLTSLNKLV